MERMWINQPSTLQAHHKLDGSNVLMSSGQFSKTVRVWFTTGDLVSMEIPRSCLSKGWCRCK